MPKTTVYGYYEEDRCPILEWLEHLKRREHRAFTKCVARIQQLAELGHELRRPAADFLRDGIYELRARAGRVNYRILYFFHGQDVVVLTHGLTKEDVVPDADLKRALRRKQLFESDPEAHTFVLGEEDG